jgi:hypothetical protein
MTVSMYKVSVPIFKRCYANTLRPRSRMLLKVSGLLRVQPLGEVN